MDSVLPHVCVSKPGIYSSVLITHPHPLYSLPSFNPAYLLMMQADSVPHNHLRVTANEAKEKNISQNIRLKHVVFPQLERVKLSTAFITVITDSCFSKINIYIYSHPLLGLFVILSNCQNPDTFLLLEK